MQRFRRAGVPLILAISALLSGCWTPPSASVRPRRQARIAEGSIAVGRVAETATVEAVDRAARTISLRVRGVKLRACTVATGVRNWEEIRVGDQVHVTIKEELTVYVAAENRAPDARVLAIEPSYRLLTVQYRDGQTETFKVGLHTRMGELEAGDAVAIRPIEALDLRLRRHRNRHESSRSSQSVTSAR